MSKHHSLVVGCAYVNLSGIGFYISATYPFHTFNQCDLKKTHAIVRHWLITKMRSLEVPYKYRHQITLTLEQMVFFLS